MRLQPQTRMFSLDVSAARNIEPPIRKLAAVGTFYECVAQFMENQLRKRVVDIEDLWNPDKNAALPVAGRVTFRTTPYFEAEGARRAEPNLIDGGGGQQAGTIARHPVFLANYR
ncbi:MAG TPA: hypothetical protein VGL59_08780 [Polyangia bacterium]